MSDNPYYRELVDFRQIMEDWLNGSTAAEDEERIFARLLAVVPEVSTRITADGVLVLKGREGLNEYRQAHGKIPGFKMWIEDFRVLWERDDLALVSFIEWSQSDNWEPFGMLSSILFRKNSDTPFGVEWVHYQETILPETETEI